MEVKCVMADAKKDNKQEKGNPSSEGFGFKQSPLGFDKNEVNLYINKLKKQMKEQQQEYEERINNMRKNLEDAHDESNAAKAAARDAAQTAPTIIGNTDADVKKAVDEAVKESEAKVMELRKLVLDERRNVAKLDKECAMAQMSEKKVREEYAKLKEKYNAAKKAGGGGKAVVTSNADEVLAEACKLAEEVMESANAYAKASVDSVNEYKAKVEAELKARSEKLEAAKKQLDEQAAKAAAENETAKNSMKEIAEKIAAVTGQLGAFAASFDAVNTQITAVTGQIDAVTGQFGTVTQQINDATAAIDGVSKQFDDVSKQMNTAVESIGGITQTMTTAAESISGVTQQFADVSGKLTGAKDSFASVSDTLEKAKTSFADVTKTVTDTKSGIDGIKTSADEAEKLTAGGASAGGADAAALNSVGEAITAATGAITAELKLPEFKASFDKAKLEELKKKLKIETTYEGGEASDDEDDDEDDILSTIEVDDIPSAPVPSDDELMADLPDLEPAPAPEPTKKAEPVKEAPKAEKKPQKKVDDDLSDFMITPTTDDDMSSGMPLINTSGVGAIDDFTLDAAPENLGDDFDLAPNDLAATPDKGMDLGEDIFNMAINPVDANDDTLNKMMSEQKTADEMGDFELTPAEIKDEYKPSSPAFGANDDFGEFADLFAAGSAETSAPAEKKKPAAFRQSGQNSDDPFNFGMDGSVDDADMSADSDLSDLLL